MLEHVIAPKRGFPPNEARKIYAELEQRANILKSLAERKYNDFYDFYNVLSRAYREGLFR